ncbi:MAG TPA: tetratricopeptide repeat protein [Gemmataceae bacterium]|nr:tetratricopeptide repeat protein [Gemmataceae bacterium]
MSIGEILTRLVLKRLMDDVFASGGAEALDAVSDFLTRCGKQNDPRLAAALEDGLGRAWHALEVALGDDSLADHRQAGLAPAAAQSLRRHVAMVLRELVQGGAGPRRPGATAVANALRRQCLGELRTAGAAGTLAGVLDTDEWARSQEILARFVAEQGRRDTRRRTEGQLIRQLEEQGCVGLMRVLTGGTGLPLLVMAGRAFVCQQLGRLLYRCLQECPEQTPSNCAVVLQCLQELSSPRFSIWRSTAAVPARTAARMSSPIPAAPPRRPPSRRPNRRRLNGDRPPVNDLSDFRRFSWELADPPRPARTVALAKPRSTILVWAALALAAVLLVVLPVCIVLADIRRQDKQRHQLAEEHRRLLDERRRLDEERRRLIDEQRRIAAKETARKQAEERQRREDERRRKAATEEARRKAEQLVILQREQEQKRREEERLARIRQEKERRANARAALARGLQHSTGGRDREALKAFDEALRLDAGIDRAWVERGLVRRRLGDDAGALDDFAEAVQRDPRDLRAWLNRGELHLRRRVYRAAIDDFTSVLRLEPKNVPAYRERGLCYSENGDFDKAIADESTAIDLAPADPRAYYYRANARRQRGDTRQALDDYSAAIDRNRDSVRELAPAYRTRGMIYLDRAEYTRAIADLTRALEREPEDTAIRRARGLAHLKNGEWNKALFDADAAIAREPRNVEALKLRGQAHLALREYRKAHGDFTRAIRLHRDAEAYYLRARTKAEAGELAEAIYDCNDAVALNPHLADAFYLRGTLRIQGGNLPRGLADRRRAHKLDPRLTVP